MKGILRWFMSRTVRQAVDLRKQVAKFLNNQRDLLDKEDVAAIEKSMGELRAALAEDTDKKTLDERIKALESVANKKLIPYPHASIRENIDVVLVAVAVALGIRTFFLQPFKIPTGSMQPTLYGITSVDLRESETEDIPGRAQRFVDACFNGVNYYQLTAPADCVIEDLSPVKSRFIFYKTQQIKLSCDPKPRTIRFPPDNFFRHDRANLRIGQRFSEGDDIVKLKVIKGDHLFVDRFTYNFRRPRRGEIIVFKTDGIDIPGVSQSLFYIKRLVATGGERVRLGDDQHLRINGERLDAATHRFENVYTFGPEWSREGHTHFGHVNGKTSINLTGQNLAPRFYSGESEFQVGANRYLVFGDNTMNSLDSRQWGDFPRENVIGRSAVVYWPFNSRFGWRPPLTDPSGSISGPR